jgi:hypothetical protein
VGSPAQAQALQVVMRRCHRDKLRLHFQAQPAGFSEQYVQFLPQLHKELDPCFDHILMQQHLKQMTIFSVRVGSY